MKYCVGFLGYHSLKITGSAKAVRSGRFRLLLTVRDDRRCIIRAHRTGGWMKNSKKSVL